MPYPNRRFSPSLESNASAGPSSTTRPSLFDTKDDFIERVSPIGMAAIYFGSFSLAPQDAALSRQALFKLSFLYRYFLQPAGLKIEVYENTATFSGGVTDKSIILMAEILARQIAGIQEVEAQFDLKAGKGASDAAAPANKAGVEAARLLLATDQTLRANLQVNIENGVVVIEGRVNSAAQKSWAELLVGSAGGDFESRLEVAPIPSHQEFKPADVDDESLQALILLRLRLIRDTEPLSVKVKATRGVVTLQGKVRTEASRQQVENIARSCLGLRELRSSLSLLA